MCMSERERERETVDANHTVETDSLTENIVEQHFLFSMTC